ncbi:hypothetical protein [Streptomyces palmae]|uniref:EamA/RhaT family transporter n=1 Tax=Streptomyces palmae TaxID=1701085 RepID=A0A4Z0G8L4_9ACTN|nr:hypothetical protein [Streptomyces palmae]TGA92582.1 hypothetical protein E4099_27485 [Streptomyces palmae]
MSDEQREQRPDGPQPEPLRFFGTTWVHHDGGYALRRVGVAAGSLVAAAAGAFVLRLGVQGVAMEQAGSLVDIMLVVVFAMCSLLAFRRTWDGFKRGPGEPRDEAVEKSMRSIRAIGFIGVLLAYFARSFAEAPGEKLLRAEYDRELAAYERRRAARTRNPAAGKKPAGAAARKRKRR